ncbi:MAG: hypothetical protein LBB75_05835, partial [Oscillospiraceae bacterium]|nr:hypothetical protein [Oscillospiraceae bacterium]
TKISLDRDNFSYPSPPDLAAMRFIGSGRADLLGEELDYDKYSAEDYHAFLFVKDGTLKGIRYAADGFTNDVEYLIMEKEVPDSVFDIPADYALAEIN